MSLLAVTSAFAQNRTVKGKVTGADDGLGLPGVSVRVKGTTIGASTGIDGDYVISVPADAKTLTFSYVGFLPQEVQIGANTTINVTLRTDAKQLDEVMVVAYGTVKKESFTGSAAVVKGDVLENRPVTSFEKALQGAVAGVTVSSVSGQPGATSTVRVRGVGSISASSTPLYVIDGVPVTTGDLTQVATTADVLSTLNSSDIESVTVLKDASASSIYGSRAANGVVLITTKKGKAGKTQFNVSSTGGYSSPAVEKHDILGADQYYKYYWNYYNKARLAAGDSPDAAALAANTSTRGTLGVNPFNTPNPYGANGTLASGAALYYDTDWRDAVLRRGVTKDLNVSASGGTDKTKFFISGGSFDQKGIVIGSDFKRYSGKINLANEVNKWLNVGINTTLGYTEQNTPAGSGGGANPVRFADLVSPVYSLYQRDASGNPVVSPEGGYVYNYVNPISLDFNPVGLAEMDQFFTRTARVIANPYAEIKFLKNFTAKTNFAVDYINNRERLFYNPLHGNGANVKGRAARYTVEDVTLTIANTLTYDKQFGVHSLNVLAGQEAYKTNYDNIQTQKTGFPFAGVDELVAGSTPVTASSYTTSKRLSSYFGRVNYDFNDKYYFSGSLRRDGSSVFGTDNKFGTFYSLGGAWRISQEDFLKNVTWLEELKLRASYGTSGNDRIGRYDAQGLYGVGYNYGGKPGITYTQLQNDQLKWESNTQTDIGIDFSLLKGRINGEASYYKRGSTGLLYAQPLSYTTGFTSIVTNLASMDNWGFDFSVGGDAIAKDNFTWTVSTNLTTNNNEIKKLTTNAVVDGTKRLVVGGNRYEFYMREWAGVNPANGLPQWYMDEIGADGKPTGNRVKTSSYNAATRYEMGSSLPKFTGGLTNKFRYKNLDLNVFMFYSVGGKVYDGLYSALMHGGATSGQSLSTDMVNAWQNPGDVADVPRFVPRNTDQSNSTSSRFLYDGSYVRLKNVTLGYNLDRSLTQRIGVNNVRIFATAENAFTFAKHKGMDPEVEITGLNDNDVPNIKTFSVGLNFGF